MWFSAAYFNSSTDGTSNYLFTIPSGYRPQSTKTGRFIGKRRTDTSNANYAFSVNSEGRVYQSFNNDGTASLWEGEIYFTYTATYEG